MRGRGWFVGLAIAAFATSTRAADLVIEAPAFVVGDSWEFVGTDNGQPYRWSRTVVAVDGVGQKATATIDFGSSGKVRLMLIGGVPMTKL